MQSAAVRHEDLSILQKASAILSGDDQDAAAALEDFISRLYVVLRLDGAGACARSLGGRPRAR
jgi:hypothetical protein